MKEEVRWFRNTIHYKNGDTIDITTWDPLELEDYLTDRIVEFIDCETGMILSIRTKYIRSIEAVPIREESEEWI